MIYLLKWPEKAPRGLVGVSLAGCTPSEYGYGLKWGVFIRGLGSDSLIYPSSLYCVSRALVRVLLQDWFYP